MTITIYIAKLCPFSKELKKNLQQSSLSYQERWVDTDEEAFITMRSLTERPVTPVVVVEKEGQKHVLIGYNQERKRELMQLVVQ